MHFCRRIPNEISNKFAQHKHANSNKLYHYLFTVNDELHKSQNGFVEADTITYSPIWVIIEMTMK